MHRFMSTAMGGLILAGLAASPALAQERYDDATVKELQRFNIRIGAFLIDSYDTTFRLDSKTVPIGTVVDLEDTLNVTNRTQSGRIDGFYRFNKKHRIDFGYYGSRRDGEAVVTEEITIGDPDDPDGEVVIPVGAQVASEWNFDLIDVVYNWSFLNTRRYELYLGGGLNIRDLEIDVTYQAEVGGEVERDQVRASGTLPLPVLSFGGRWNFVRTKWQANWQWKIFALEVGDYQGLLRDTLVTFEHNTFKNVGFGGGLNAASLDVRADGEDLRGEIDSSYLGLLAYVKVYF